MDEVTLKLVYAEGEVVSAQRTRFLHSSRLKMITAFGIVGTVTLTAQTIYFWYAKGTVPASWFVPIVVAAIFIVIPGFTYFLAPRIDYHINPVWRCNFDLRISEDRLRLTTDGKSEGFELAWRQVRQVLENAQVYVLFFGSGGQDFFILPKRVLGSGGQEDFLPDILKRSTSPSWTVTR